jgi:hypothetical protein
MHVGNRKLGVNGQEFSAETNHLWPAGQVSLLSEMNWRTGYEVRG